MKKLLILVSAAVLSTLCCNVVSAQDKYGPNKEECIKYLSFYTDYYKQKNYDAALPSWRKAYSLCPPTASYNLLSNGTKLISNLINKNAKNPIYKAELVDSLMTIYDQMIENYPKYAVGSRNNKALNMYNFYKDEPKKLYEGLDAVISANQEKTKANILLFHVNTAISLYKDGVLDEETVINVYENAMDLIAKIEPKTEIEKKSNEKIKEDIDNLFSQSQVASCEKLLEIFTPKLEADPSVDLAKNIVKIMVKTDDCANNELFLNAVTIVYNNEPSHTAAYSLYRLNSARDNFDDAHKYMLEAIESAESDNAADAGYYFELATYCVKNGKNSVAYDYCNKALALDDSIAGKVYFLMGTIWGSTVCGGNDIERRAPYWVAIDYMNKAKAADESLAESANNYIRQYSAFFPQAAEAFMYDVVAGQSYTVSCNGMRATTTVRTQK